MPRAKTKNGEIKPPPNRHSKRQQRQSSKRCSAQESVDVGGAMAVAAGDSSAATPSPAKRGRRSRMLCADQGAPADSQQVATPVEEDRENSGSEPDAPLVGAGEFTSFASRVLHVVQSIPAGKVCAYGQVAALAGAPRNAREVGRLLKEGLSRPTGAPWFRVLNSSGKISLHGVNQLRQRTRLEAEGVEFRSSGAVVAGTFWEPEHPDEFFVGWGR